MPPQIPETAQDVLQVCDKDIFQRRFFTQKYNLK